MLTCSPILPSRRQLLTFVVAGGGFAGVETLAELNDFVRGAGRFYPHISPDEIRMILIHSGDRILPEVSESLSTICAQQARKPWRRSVAEDARAKVVAASGSADGRQRNRCPHIRLGGRHGAEPGARFGRGCRGAKQAASKSTRRWRRRVAAGVWAVGDSATIPDVVTGGTCPPTAQYALRQGRRLADNIAAAKLAATSRSRSASRPWPARRAGPALGRGRDFRPAILRVHRLVAVADDLPDEAPRL